jgi:hypothetical protein
MGQQNKISVIPDEIIMNKILLIRGKRVIIGNDLAVLYGVTTKRLNEQVKRNIKRFPAHFMFQLSKEEKDNVVANCDHLQKLKYSPFLPYAFTEYGTVMLANVLNSERAIQASVRIVEIFIKIREIILSHKAILQKIEQIQKKLIEHDNQLLIFFKYLKRLEQAKQEEINFKRRKKIGFKQDK